ncbi:MAG: hypothetical protein O3B43_05670 [Chloroflexi bacterium]|nr:hypothetical protein [Chloroflexota bacterium]
MAGVERVVVRAAHSIRASEGGLIFGDENTFSSLRETPGDITVAALTTNGNVLALPDLTFLTGPYNTFADNDLFIDNVVGFLLGGDRRYELLDFPHYFDETVEFIFPDSGFFQQTFGTAAALRQALEAAGIEPNQDDNLLPGDQALIVANYSGLDSQLRDLLIQDGIRVNSVGNLISLRDIGELDRSGSVLFHLHQEESGSYQLFILADGPAALERGVVLLLEGELESCLVRPATAFCGSDTLATPTPTPEPTRTPFATSTPAEELESTPDSEPTPTASG